MDPICLAHQFFHFSLPQWTNHWNGASPSIDQLHILFQQEIFCRRCLKVSFPLNLKEAIATYSEILKRQKEIGIRSILSTDKDYPPTLTENIPPERRPTILYVRGQNPREEKELVGMVGTRHPSSFGEEVSKNFAAYFTALNISVISGLARGIDANCHRENLRMRTVAILGSSVDQVYPYENQNLAEQIAAQGTLISPFPLYQVPLPHNFPMRNEIIAAMAAGLVVVEGSEKSGASVTGKLALAMDKTVVVLAQDFQTAFGRGAIRLQQAGATLVASEEESLQAIYSRFGGYQWKSATPCPRATTFTFQKFLEATQRTVPEALALLQEGLLTGKIVKIGVDRYRKAQ